MVLAPSSLASHCSGLRPASQRLLGIAPWSHRQVQQQEHRAGPLAERCRRAAAASSASDGAQPASDEPGELEAAPPPLDRAQEERLRLQYERGNCYGCGVRLHTLDTEVTGFVSKERYEVKRRHRQLGQLLCQRCQELCNGAMIPAVADFAQREQAASAPRQQQQGRQQERQVSGAVAAAAEVQHAEVAGAAQGQGAGAEQQQSQVEPGQRHTGFTDKVLLTPEELREKLKVVQHQKALVVLLVDLLDASGSIMGRVRELVGNNPIMLVGTKVDLLPPGIDPAEVADWLQATAAFKRINAVSVHLVSAKSGAGVPAAVAAIRRERRGRDVFVMGAANVGKSAFIRSLVRDMSKMSSRQFDPLALSRGKFLPVESAMPGTTLELIPMEVFAAGGMLYDTPGLHLHHRVPHLLTPAENKQLHPRRKIRPYVPPSPSELLEVTTAMCAVPTAGAAGRGAGATPADATSAAAGRVCPVATYFWGGLVKLQVLSCPADTELVFYGPQALLVEASVEDAEAPSGASAFAAAAAATQHGSTDASGSSSDSDGGKGAGEMEEPHGFGAASVIRRGGLRPAKELAVGCAGGGGARRPVADIAISGIPGWVAVYTSSGRSDAVQVRVWTPPGVEVFSRPPLPVPCPLAEPDQPWLAPLPPLPVAAGAAAAQAGGGAPPAGDLEGLQSRREQPAEDWW